MMTDTEKNKAKKIIGGNKIRSINDLKLVIGYWYSVGNSDSDILNTVNDMEFCWQIKTIPPLEIAQVIMQECLVKEYELSVSDIVLYSSEVDKLLEIDDNNVRKLMYCFLVYSKINNHSSGWIKYDKETIFNIGGFSNNIGNKYVPLCCKNGLELRVIGAKHSLVCYRIDFKKIDGESCFKIHVYEDIMNKYNEFIERKPDD